MFKIIENGQLFVYYKGELIYKRWLKTGQSIVVENIGPPTWSSERSG